MLLGRRYLRQKQQGWKTRLGQSDPNGQDRTSARIAAEHAVSEKTVRRAAEAVAALPPRSRTYLPLVRRWTWVYSLRRRPQCKAGELLAGLERDGHDRGNQYRLRPTSDTASPYAAALNDSGTTRQDANRWQDVASAIGMSGPQYQRAKHIVKAAEGEGADE